MKGYDFIGRYKYEVPKKTGILKKTIPGNRFKILQGVKKEARKYKDKKKWTIVTENKSEHTFSLYVKKD